MKLHSLIALSMPGRFVGFLPDPAIFA